MKTILKSMFVWLLLLAVPFQGYAAASMLICAPISGSSHGAAQASVRVAHAIMVDQQASAPHCAGHHGDSKVKAGHHADSKCNSCASCCVGAALMSSATSQLHVEPQHFFVTPFVVGAVPAVHLALPERPPQA